MPASATSIGNVTCFSISRGDSAGAKALTWTWTLVMSGTASIGRTVSGPGARDRRRDREQQHVPAAAHREGQDPFDHGSQSSARAFRNSALSTNVLVTAIVSPARTPARTSLMRSSPCPSVTERFSNALRRAHEHDLRLAHGLDRARRHRERSGTFLDRDGAVDEGARPPVAVRVGDLRHHAGRMGLAVQHRTDEHDLADGAIRQPVRRDRYRLPLLDQRKVGRADGKIDPDAIEIRDREQLGLQIVPADRGAEIDLAVDDASGNRRLNVLPAQARFRLAAAAPRFPVPSTRCANSFWRAMSRFILAWASSIAGSQHLLLRR